MEEQNNSAGGANSADGKQKEEFFPPLQADNNEEITEIDSLCMECMGQGKTRLLLVKIPFFKEVVVASFHCESCHFQNAELQSVAAVAPEAVELVLKVNDKSDMTRMVVKTHAATVDVPEIQLEVTPTQKGEVTTVEGVLVRVITGLSQDQDRRKMDNLEAYNQIEAYIDKIRELLELRQEFTLKISDLTGNSFIGPRNNATTTSDRNLSIRKWQRTAEEDQTIGVAVPGDPESIPEEDEENANLKDEVLQIPTNCPECNAACFTKMKVTDIPFFKEVVIMATDCDQCGHRTNEVKSGGGIEPKGKRIQLKVSSHTDLCRDILKSDTCSIKIVELDIEAGGHAIVGKFTTVEGLLEDIKKQFSEENPLYGGDSVDPKLKEKMQKLCEGLDRLITGKQEFTLILDDPAGNSYIQNYYAPEPDPAMEVTEYERSFEDNEELGLNDMKV